MSMNYITEITLTEPESNNSDGLVLNVRGLAANAITIESSSRLRSLTYEIVKSWDKNGECGSEEDIIESTKVAIDFLKSLEQTEDNPNAALPPDIVTNCISQLSVNLDTI